MFELTLEIDVLDEDKARAAKNALLKDLKTARSEVTIKNKNSTILINVKAGDKTAIRSAANANLRLLSTCLECLNL